MENIGVVVSTITNGCMCFKSEPDGLRKIKKCTEKWILI